MRFRADTMDMRWPLSSAPPFLRSVCRIICVVGLAVLLGGSAAWAATRAPTHRAGHHAAMRRRGTPHQARPSRRHRHLTVPTPSAATTRVIPIGTAVNLPDLTGSDPRYRDTLDSHFTGITPENEMKWDTTEPQQGVFNFAPADAIVSYAEAHNMSVHGHNLVWNQQLPTWLTEGSWTKDELEAILKQHIQTEVSHFSGEVHEWDVVNEPFNDDGTLEDNLWLRVIGPDYIPLALTWAHEADPTAKLFINDYNVDWPGPKEQAMLALATRLLDDGVPLNGIGMEEHLSLSWSPSADQLAQAMGDFAALGLQIEVSEADVDTTGFAGTTAEAQSAEASVFSELATACRAQPACVRFTVWGVSDAVSWLGAAAAGLPFDTDYRAKPAWQAIVAGLANPAQSS
jgi:endo-1,4-beta-xylanase